ncbi:unnamed protein product [Toxocara canis]|uniref:Aluminum-activated malate transporter n=1 Tax=Toxocara canis TaxID=6265 RepID=A0A183U1S1_TOXCA|nr:unnamed protein product [Toxocara canis]
MEEMRKLLVATIRNVLGSFVLEKVSTLANSLHSTLNSSSERLQTMERDTSIGLQSLEDTVATFQHTSRSTHQPENCSTFTFDAEEQQRRRSAVFIVVAESCDPPHLRHERAVESVAVILGELNVEGVPLELYRMGVINPA